MEDDKIVELYWVRSEEAIPATSQKYGAYLSTIARNILESREDTEECLNDTYLHAWNSMPPKRPALLKAFLGKMIRNISFNRYKHNHAGKRGGGETALILEELTDCVSGREDVEQEMDRRELVTAINAFLAALPSVKRRMFVCRYWYADSISAIARQFDTTEGSVAMTLSRLRKQLKEYLTEQELYV
ncbi:MAG: RNA polymerase sigma factor [Lachnospiraceae bacterium]